MDRFTNPPPDPYPRDTELTVESEGFPKGVAGTVGAVRPEPLRKNRADLVLFLGIVSLLMCGPLGIVPWLMANSDLKGVRNGTVSPDGVGPLKMGKALGIAGTALFLLTLVVAFTAVYRGFDPTAHDGAWSALFSGPRPLPPNKIVYAGEWLGHRGTFLRINPDGTGDFKSRETALQGGKVTIDDHSITIGSSGASKVWAIERTPAMKNGIWKMRLNGEVFRRQARGFLVRA